MKIRTPRLMVAEKTSKPEGNQFLKVTDIRYLTLSCENEISNQRFKRKKDKKRKYGQQMQKRKKDNKRNTPVSSGNFFLIAPFCDDLPTFTFSCLGRRLLRVCDVFKFVLILIDVVCF